MISLLTKFFAVEVAPHVFILPKGFQGSQVTVHVSAIVMRILPGENLLAQQVTRVAEPHKLRRAYVVGSGI
jgi:hypothetical protein